MGELWPFGYCTAITAAFVALAHLWPCQRSVDRHIDRSFSDFASFWPLYVSQHRAPLTKLLHAVSTSAISLVVMTRYKPVIALRFGLGLISGISLSLCTVDWTASFPNGLPEALLMVFFIIACVRQMAGLGTTHVARLLAAGYLLPWAAHFFIERNRPATFLHPTFSLLGDFKLLGLLLTNQIALDASTA